MRLLTAKRLLRDIQSELNSLRKIKVEETDKDLLNKKIQKAKAVAYLVNVSLQVIEAEKYNAELEEIQEEIEELKSEKGNS